MTCPAIMDGKYIGNPFGFVDHLALSPNGSVTVVMSFPPGLPEEFVDAVCVEAAVRLQVRYIEAGLGRLTIRDVQITQEPAP